MERTIAERLAELNSKIELAADKAGRKAEDIQLLAVSKTMPAEMVIEAYDAGQKHFGENRMQEVPEKIAEVGSKISPFSGLPTWHFIGHLQSNKVRKVLELFDYIQSIDSFKLIDRIDRIAGEIGKTARCLLQVNISGSESQFGFEPGKIVEAAGSASGRENLVIDGLMTIGPLTNDEVTLRKAFSNIRRLSEEISSLNLPGISMSTLSMGMSGDYKIAIEEGSTIVRVGTLIFGERKKF